MTKIIDIIQGDSANYLIGISSVEDISLIERMSFCSSRLGIYKEIMWNEELNSYVLSFSAEETRQYPSCRADYNITIVFTDGKVRTPTLKGEMFIREKDCGRN